MSMTSSLKAAHPAAGRPLLIILLFFSLYGNASAQNTFHDAIRNYQDAVAILNTGDTLHGQIDNREWLITPHEIEFVQKEQKRIFTALDLKEFQGRRQYLPVGQG